MGDLARGAGLDRLGSGIGRGLRIVALAVLVVEAAAVAEPSGSGFTRIPPFVGTHSEGFENYMGVSPPCVLGRVFDDRADLCSASGTFSVLLALGAGSVCSIEEHGGTRFVTCPSNALVFRFDAPVERFGAWFGAYAIPGAQVRFFGADGALLFVDDVDVPLDCTWYWYGWDMRGAEVLRIAVTYIGSGGGGGGVALDDAELDLEPQPVGLVDCVCDGSGAAAPCGNESWAGRGCENGAQPIGCRLTAYGDASLASDSLVLLAHLSTPGQPGLFFQGDQSVGGGAGIPFGDGLRCAGGGVVRLQVRVADPFGGATTTLALGAAGGVAVGDTRRYQWWYRDPASSPCGSGFNLSNAVELLWGP